VVASLIFSVYANTFCGIYRSLIGVDAGQRPFIGKKRHPASVVFELSRIIPEYLGWPSEKGQVSTENRSIVAYQ
jgi:hypothetical protein